MGNFVFDEGVLDIVSCAGGLIGDLLTGNLAEYEALEERVAAESICTVKLCRGYFATGIKVFNACFRRGICLYAANHVVCTGPDWYQIFSDINIEAFA